MRVIVRGFDGAFAWIVLAEAGYVDDRRDPGGETKYGISKRSYPAVDIPSLTLDQAREIYRRDFWSPLHCDDLPAPWALALFDAGVLQGNGPAVRLLQCALDVSMDGVIGPVTLNAVRQSSLEQGLTAFLSWRVFQVSTSPHASTYIRGWSRRLFRLQQECLRLANTR